MSDLEMKAKNYADKLDNYKTKTYSITPTELSQYHSIAEQEFDKSVTMLEDSIQKDIREFPEIISVLEKINVTLKE